MAVDDARNRRSTGKIDMLGAGTDQRLYLGVRTERDDPTIAHRERGHESSAVAGPARRHGRDLSGGQNEIGGNRCRNGHGAGSWSCGKRTR